MSTKTRLATVHVGVSGKLIKVSIIRKFVKKYPDCLISERLRQVFEIAKFFRPTEYGWQRIKDEKQLKVLRLLSKRSIKTVQGKAANTVVTLSNELWSVAASTYVGTLTGK